MFLKKRIYLSVLLKIAFSYTETQKIFLVYWTIHQSSKRKTNSTCRSPIFVERLASFVVQIFKWLQRESVPLRTPWYPLRVVPKVAGNPLHRFPWVPKRLCTLWNLLIHKHVFFVQNMLSWQKNNMLESVFLHEISHSFSWEFPRMKDHSNRVSDRFLSPWFFSGSSLHLQAD